MHTAWHPKSPRDNTGSTEIDVYGWRRYFCLNVVLNGMVDVTPSMVM